MSASFPTVNATVAAGARLSGTIRLKPTARNSIRWLEVKLRYNSLMRVRTTRNRIPQQFENAREAL